MFYSFSPLSTETQCDHTGTSVFYSLSPLSTHKANVNTLEPLFSIHYFPMSTHKANVNTLWSLYVLFIIF